MCRISTLSFALLLLLLSVPVHAKTETTNDMLETCHQRFRELLEENFTQTWEVSEAERLHGDKLLTYVKQKPHTDEEVVVVAISNNERRKGELGKIVFVTFYANGVVCGMKPLAP